MRTQRMLSLVAALSILLCSSLFPQRASAVSKNIVNPLLPSGPDPWVEYEDGLYYVMRTTGDNLTLWKTRSLAELKSAPSKVIWTPPSSGPYAHDIWAPEIHFLRGRWYVYFAADAGTNLTHRIYVLENSNPDPFQGDWQFKGKISDASDKWAIDASVFEDQGVLYMIWSGWEGDENGTQNIYIARLSNPWTVESKRTRISTPEYPWEKVGDLPPKMPGGNPPHIDVNEGPEILVHGGKLFLTYSASACWTDYYALGMLTAVSGSDLLNARSWTKSSNPVFQQSPSANVYAAGSSRRIYDSTSRTLCIVSASGVPCGRITITMKLPWSSSGRNALGSCVSISAAAAVSAPYTTSQRSGFFSIAPTRVAYRCVERATKPLNQPKKPRFS